MGKPSSLANPLDARLGREFFKTLPRRPGVYLMFGLGGQVIYVGKAKNLYARLQSYRRAKSSPQVSRKVLRLVRCIEEIRYEICESETRALLRENELLRLHRPVFNVVNKSPEGYLFIGVRSRPSDQIVALEFKLTTRAEAQTDWPLDSFFGAFKGKSLVREGVQALLRLLWATQFEGERFEYPRPLTRKRIPRAYEWRLREGPEGHTVLDREAWLALVRDFLSGESADLLERLTSELLSSDRIPAFYYRSIQDDLELAKIFYESAPARNRGVRETLGLNTRLIPQIELDDLLVLSAELRRKKS
jgi:excinuclease UvrABC nuclease subunit